MLHLIFHGLTLTVHHAIAGPSVALFVQVFPFRVTIGAAVFFIFGIITGVISHLASYFLHFRIVFIPVVTIDVYQAVFDKGLPVGYEVVLDILLCIDETGLERLGHGNAFILFQLILAIAVLEDAQCSCLAESLVGGMSDIGVARFGFIGTVQDAVRDEIGRSHLFGQGVFRLVCDVVGVTGAVHSRYVLVGYNLTLTLMHDAEETIACTRINLPCG